MIEISDVSSAASTHSCGCGRSVSTDIPELDATLIPPALRHPAIFGALDSLASGQAMVLKAPHKPQRLLNQIEERTPGVFAVTYLNEGPETWRLQLTRA